MAFDSDMTGLLVVRAVIGVRKQKNASILHMINLITIVHNYDIPLLCRERKAASIKIISRPYSRRHSVLPEILRQ